MARTRLLWMLMPALLYSATLPAGTELSIRLSTAVSSRSSPGSGVEARIIASASVQGKDVATTGLVVRGVVADASRKLGPDGRSALLLAFHQITAASGATLPIQAEIIAVDNARESVGGAGIIYGLKPMRVRPTKVEDVLLLAAHAHPAILAMFEVGKLILSRTVKPEIDYGPGVEMTVRLATPVEMPGLAFVEDAAHPAPNAGLTALVDAQPLRTVAANVQRPSDMINVIFLGTEEDLRSAFLAAGWSTAAAASLRNDAKTFFAIAEHHAYQQAPVSTLLLEGRAPDLVFQKQNDTFAKRHHIRLWKRDAAFDGRPVWAGAATHDTGIVFSREARTFTHRVEPSIDLERKKVLDDLRFTGRVSAFTFVERPTAPKRFSNATGDALETDGAVAVISIRKNEGS